MRRFSRTLKVAKISRPCGTNPMPSRARAVGERRAMSSSPRRMRPAVTGR